MRMTGIAATLALLLAACTPAARPDSAASAPQRFICDRGQSLSIAFSGPEARVSSDQGTARLASQPVGSGFHYVGEGQSIRGKGFELEWTHSDGTRYACREEQWAMRQPQIQPPSPAIRGSSWVLVSFQSPDDAIGTLVPPNIDRYTIAFEADGSLAAQLDCNRARGSWQVTSQSDAGGTLTIKGGAMTRAMCGPGALDTQIARDLGRVRSFTIRDGHLFLALEADSGIYEFRPM